MKLPKQAKPVVRKSSTAKFEVEVGQSGGCEALCNLLPEPARSICKAAC